MNFLARFQFPFAPPLTLLASVSIHHVFVAFFFRRILVVSPGFLLLRGNKVSGFSGLCQFHYAPSFSFVPSSLHFILITRSIVSRNWEKGKLAEIEIYRNELRRFIIVQGVLTLFSFCRGSIRVKDANATEIWVV